MSDRHVDCRDCGVDTIAIGHWYMVEDRVAGLDPDDGVLCLSDLERRLGRPLVFEDFKPTGPENREFWGGSARMLPQVWRDRWPEPYRKRGCTRGVHQ